MKGLPSYSNPHLNRWQLPEGVPGTNVWYRFWQWAYQMLATSVWRLQVFNRHLEPRTGSALYLSNHQSFLDPAIMSLALTRPMNFMARDSLFRFPVFGRWITSLKAFPVRRGVADTAAMKEGLRRLKRGGQLVVFPEGTRTRDGTIGPFLPGVALLARRAAEWVVPVTIDGAFEVWPRTDPLPWLGSLVVAYCEPLSRLDRRGMSDGEVLDVCRDRMIAMQKEIRQRRGLRPMPYPEQPPGATP